MNNEIACLPQTAFGCAASVLDAATLADTVTEKYRT